MLAADRAAVDHGAVVCHTAGRKIHLWDCAPRSISYVESVSSCDVVLSFPKAPCHSPKSWHLRSRRVLLRQ